MSPPPIRHPDDRLLIAFKLSKLDQRQVALVNQHLQDCQACQRRLAGLSNERQEPATRANAPRRWPKLVWPAAGGGALLLGLVIAWGAGAFQGQTNPEATAVENRPLPIQPSAKQPTTPSPSSAAAPGGSTVSPVSKVPEVPKVEASAERASTAAAANDPPKSIATRTQEQPGNTQEASPTFFNGKDLAGWQGSTDIWHVENGAIVGSLPAAQKPSTFLCSRQRYKDFDLMFRASLADGIGDCGVQFRSRVSDGDKLQLVGPQCAIYGKDAPPDHRTGSLMTEPGDKVEKSPPLKRVESFVEPAENHFRIRCQGKHVLIEVNGIKMVNGEFPSLPDEGVIAWKIDARRPPHKVIFTMIKFTELTQSPSQEAFERPSLLDAELLKAEIKFETAMKKADETLLNRFDPEITKLKRSSHSRDKELIDVVEHEKDLFKEKGLIPWSRPMRKWLLQYGKELHDAQRAVGTSFDTAIERAEKSHNDKLKAALIAEAGQVLAPREVATWQRSGKTGRVDRRMFYSDGTFAEGDQQEATTSRFWTPPADDVLILEFPDKEDSTETDQKAFLLSPDGKTLTSQSKKGDKQVWQHAEDSRPIGGS
jgi:hypothetical protein